MEGCSSSSSWQRGTQESRQELPAAHTDQRSHTHLNIERDEGCYSAAALRCGTLKHDALSLKRHGTVIPRTSMSYNREG